MCAIILVIILVFYYKSFRKGGEGMAVDNTCVCCGEIIPEGRQYCLSCEDKAYYKKASKLKAQGFVSLNIPDAVNFMKQWDKARLRLRRLCGLKN